MGNETSKQAADLRYLSDRVPFDEAEIRRLVSGLQSISDGSYSEDDCSLLSEWSKHNRVALHESPNDSAGSIEEEEDDDDDDGESSSDDKEETQESFDQLLEWVERETLPSQFGEQLITRVLHLRPKDNDSSNEKLVDDDWTTRRQGLEANLEGLANCCGRRGSRAALGTIFQLCCCAGDGSSCVRNSKDLVDSQGREIKAEVRKVLDLAYRLALATAVLRNEMDARESSSSSSTSSAAAVHHLDSLTTSCLDFVRQQRLRRSVALVALTDEEDADLDEGWCSKMDFIEWAESATPLLATILPAFLHTVLFPDQPPPSNTSRPFHFPQLCEKSFIWTDNLLPVLFSFGCMSKSLGGNWHRLYTSCSDGLSFNRLQNALLGYSGPTLLVIRASDSGSIFGAFTASPWKESKDYYGTGDCFLYQLSPVMTVCRPSGRDKNYMFCRSSSQANHRGLAPHGVGFGGSTTRSPRLFLDESFCGCFVSCQDTTFEPGYLLPRTDSFSQKTFFNVDQIEVWGCGGDEMVTAALAAQSKDRAVRAAYLCHARKVDKSAFVNDLRSGLIENKAFGHVDEIHGSTRFRLLSRTKSKKGYY